MAILKGLNGSAHVTMEGNAEWSGYILLEPDIGNMNQFDIAGPTSMVTYEGPVFADNQYFLASGKVRVLEVHYTPEELKIEFRGIEPLNIIRPLQGRPKDYLP